MLVMATFMVVAAKLQRNWARTSGTSTAPAMAAGVAEPVGAVASMDFDIVLSLLTHECDARPHPRRHEANVEIAG
jgi:hypothetical protein